MGRRIRIAAGLFALAEVVVFVLVAQWIGAGATVLLALATSALGWALLARQGTRALSELRESARRRRTAGKELGDAGLVAVGGLLYSVGVLFYVWHRLKFQNAIWHGFVAGAAGCHYAAIAYCMTGPA